MVRTTSRTQTALSFKIRLLSVAQPKLLPWLLAKELSRARKLLANNLLTRKLRHPFSSNFPCSLIFLAAGLISLLELPSSFSQSSGSSTSWLETESWSANLPLIACFTTSKLQLFYLSCPSPKVCLLQSQWHWPFLSID